MPNLARTPFVEIETKTRIKLDIEMAAKWFASLTDDDQAKFFVAVAKESESWPKGGNLNFGPSFHWWNVGSHLKNCECSSEGARELVRSMHEGLCEGTH